MVLLIGILCLLLYQCYNNNKEGFAIQAIQGAVNITQPECKQNKDGTITCKSIKYRVASNTEINNLLTIFNKSDKLSLEINIGDNEGFDKIISQLKNDAKNFPPGYLYIDTLMDRSPKIVKDKDPSLKDKISKIKKKLSDKFKNYEILLLNDILRLLSHYKVEHIEDLESKIKNETNIEIKNCYAYVKLNNSTLPSIIILKKKSCKTALL
jgi:hypothetical protein